MNLKHRILLLLYKYPNIKLSDLRVWLSDVSNEVIKAELVRLRKLGLIQRNGKRTQYRYALSPVGQQYIENRYLAHRFYELKLVDSMLFEDFNVR
jgi:DNA-binding HxlR family transcriptional regulator